MFSRQQRGSLGRAVRIVCVFLDCVLVRGCVSLCLREHPKNPATGKGRHEAEGDTPGGASAQNCPRQPRSFGCRGVLVRTRALEKLPDTAAPERWRRHRQMGLSGTAREWSRDKCARPPASTGRRSIHGSGSAPRCGRGAWGMAPMLQAMGRSGDAAASSTRSPEKEMINVEFSCRRDPWTGLRFSFVRSSPAVTVPLH